MVNLPPPESDDRQPVRPARDNDEAIAIAIAFLSIGTVLWWGWTRGQEFFAPVVSLPELSGSSLVEGDEFSGAVAAPEAETQNRPFSFMEDDRPVEADPETRSRGLVDMEDERINRARSIGALPAAGAGSALVLEDDAPELTDDRTALTETAPEEAAPESLPELDISDVSTDYWAYPYIVSLYEADLLPNLTTSELQPDKELTRAEMAALLNSSFVGGEAPQRSLNFTDITADYWAAGAVKQVVDAGYMTGFPDATFKPNELVPRYQVLVTMATGLGLTPPDNVDETLTQFQGTQNLPNWARSQVAAAAAAGLIVNHPDPQQLEPQQPATRAELIAIIHRALASQGRLEPVDTPFAAPTP